MAEGIEHLIKPEQIDGHIIIWISILALIIDAITAKISHHDSHHNSNMKMVFIHNLADAFGSIGVIISGLFVIYFNIYRIDGIIALDPENITVHSMCVKRAAALNFQKIPLASAELADKKEEAPAEA